MSVGLFVYGSQGGLGKSARCYGRSPMRASRRYSINSHITPLALYTTPLSQPAGRVIFFDDVDSDIWLDVSPRAVAVGSLG